jgi:hypothetical protein
MNREQKLIEKNIELSAEFSRYLFDHPEIGDQIPLDSELVLIPEYDDELKKFNLTLGKKMEEEGEKVTYVIIRSIQPKSLSRLEHVELSSTACA